MARMVLGGHTFAHNPNKYRRVTPIAKAVAAGHTLESEFLIDFRFRGDGVVGERYQMIWRALSRTEFNLLRDKYELGEEMTWDPRDYRAHLANKTYQVIVVDCYATDYANTTTTVEDVYLVLDIKSVN